MSKQTIRPKDYSHSPVHYAVATGDRTGLARLVSTLPRLADPAQIRTESESLSQEHIADKISAAIDRRDVPNRETPLHLAVRLNDAAAAKTLASAGADVSLQDSSGWNPLQEAMCRRSSEIAGVLLRLHHRSAWSKWRRRLPRLVAALRRMPDFYMEISFHFESSVIPFVGKIAPSDTYKIWKRDGNLRADTSLAGFDGLKIQRADQSFLFLGDGDGELLVLNRDQRRIYDAFENAGAPISDSDMAGFVSQTSVYRPGMDVTKAELVGKSNWRRQEKVETVGDWKARVYDIHNVVFSFRSRKVTGGGSSSSSSADVLPLELDEDDDGFLVAENFNVGASAPDRRRHSSFVREDREFISVGRKSVDIIPAKAMAVAPARKRVSAAAMAVPTPSPATKEKEFVRSLRPSVWLTEQFPLRTEELLPLLDILASKVKAVRRMREVLTTKFPAGTFPVKLAIPVVPTVRVVITFTKFTELQPVEQFFTPLSSPRHFVHVDDKKSTSLSWLRRNGSQSTSAGKNVDSGDPFAIPAGYTWASSAANDRARKLMKSKSVRKSSTSNSNGINK